jgi:hypothetical protein
VAAILKDNTLTIRRMAGAPEVRKTLSTVNADIAIFLGKAMHGLRTALIQCPYCWEQIEVLVDCSVESEEYVEDCSVCCRPITIAVVSSDGEVVSIEGRSENE